MQGWKEKETQIKNIQTKNMFFTEPNKAFEEECRSTGQGQSVVTEDKIGVQKVHLVEKEDCMLVAKD